MKKSFLLAIVSFVIMVPDMDSAELNVSYNTEDGQLINYGYHKKEEYDVAIRLCDPSLVGARVTGMIFSIAASPEVVNNCSAWLSSELRLERINGKNINVPDICSREFIPETGLMTVTFDSPYTIPEEGVFIGYSLNITSTDDGGERPINLVAGDNPEGLYLHASRSQLTWASMVRELQMVSPLTVILEGDFYANAAAISIPVNMEAEIGTEYLVPATVINNGTGEINSVSYSYEIGEVQYEGIYDFEDPIPARFWASRDIEIPLKMPETPGNYEIAIEIGLVNGNPNGSLAKEAKGSLDLLSFIPTYRPLVEEYTGLWCQWCPGGTVAMERLAEDYPDRFVGVAYHYNDPMQFISEESFPVNPYSYPYLTINRLDSENPLIFPSLYPSYLNRSALADIDVEVKWDDENKKGMTATSTLRFLDSLSDARFKIAYILVADSLENSSWMQSNAFAGGSPQEYPGHFWEPFIYGSSRVGGLKYNNVAVYYSDISGVENSVPSEINANQYLSHEYHIEMSDVINSDGDNIVNLSEVSPSYRIIAILLDCSSWNPVIVNCSSSSPIQGFSFVKPSLQEDIIVTLYYDLQGNRVKNPGKGVFVKTDVMSNGSLMSSKIIRK